MSLFSKITRRNLSRFLAPYASDKKVLDVGSGGSAYSSFFPNRVSVDIDPGRKPDIVGDAQSLPFSDGEFEIIICTEVLEHIENPFKAEKEFWRVLKPGGILILTTRFIFPIHDSPGDFWRFTKYGLRKLFVNWEIEKLTAETASLSTLAVLFQRMGYQMRFRANKITKLVLFLLAWALHRMNWLVVGEWGDIGKNKTEDGIMSSGYYLACRKPYE